MIAILLAIALQTAPPPSSEWNDRPDDPAVYAMEFETIDAVSAVVDAFHDAAARADGPAYFALFAPGGRFIGTDATERWSVQDFRAYAEPYFSVGRGWTYHPRNRVVRSSGDMAWFDEILDHDSYGVLRGSGVLVRTADGWKIEQYVLSFAVPNEVADDVVARIRAGASAEAPATH